MQGGGWEDMKFAILYRCITLMTGGRGWSCPPSAWDVQAWQACLTEKLLDISQRGSILLEGPGACYYIILVCSLGVTLWSNQYLSAYYVPGTMLGSESQGPQLGTISKGHKRMTTPNPLGVLVHPQKSIGHQAYAY